MRIRSAQHPPTREEIDRILKEGASSDDQEQRPALLRRLRQGFFLDSHHQPLSARERLVQQYKKDGLVLFLGAGVSVGNGIPNWPKLANDVLLASGIVPAELPNVQKSFPSYLAQFELARQLLGTDRKLIATIYQELYKGTEGKLQLEKIPRKYEEQIGWYGWPEVVKALQPNKTLEALGNLLITYDGTKARRNPTQNSTAMRLVSSSRNAIKWSRTCLVHANTSTPPFGISGFTVFR